MEFAVEAQKHDLDLAGAECGAAWIEMRQVWSWSTSAEVRTEMAKNAALDANVSDEMTAIYARHLRWRTAS